MRHPFCLTEAAKSVELPVAICTGSVSLMLTEWKDVKPGDFILLDRGGYNPRHHEGAAYLTAGNVPLFNVSIKENKLKLLDYTQVYEEVMKKSEPLNNDQTEDALHPEEERVATIKDVPLQITVELARLRMTVDQVMKLAPGNFLELPIHPEQEVALTVNGQKIGRAELVYLGEALGIRILETA